MRGRRWLALVLGVLVAGCGGEQPDAGSAAGGPAPEQRHRWKLVTTWPANFPVLQEGVERFADSVEAMSAGRLYIEVFAGGELVPALEVFDAVSLGAVEMGHGSAYYWAGKIPAAQFLSTVPFGMNAQGMNAWLYAGGGLEIWRELYEPFGVIPVPLGNTGQQTGGWFNKRIESAADLDGLKMRIPGLGGKVLDRAGGNPVLLAGAEVYTALERGVIDATEWIGPFHDLRLGLDRAARYYYYPGWHEPGTALELIVGREAWNEITPDLRRMIEVAAAEAGAWMLAEMDVRNAQALIELREASHVEILQFPPDVIAELRRMTAEVLAAEAEKDAGFQRVYDAYQRFREPMDAWRRIAEDAYRDLREAR